MVSYDLYYIYVSPVGTKSAESFSVNPIVVHMKWAGAQRLDIFEWSHYWLGAVEQFEDQATNRLLIVVLEEYEDSGTTQKEDVKKTPAKMLPSTKHYVYYMHFCCKWLQWNLYNADTIGAI